MGCECDGVAADFQWVYRAGRQSVLVDMKARYEEHRNAKAWKSIKDTFWLVTNSLLIGLCVGTGAAFSVWLGMKLFNVYQIGIMAR